MNSILKFAEMNEWIIFAIFLSILFLLVGSAEVIRLKLKKSPEFSRKFVHIIVGLIISTTPYFFKSAIPVLVMATIFVLINYLTTKLNLLKGMHGTERITYGTTYFPLAFFILVFWLWDSDRFIISISMLVLALADAIAAIVGGRIKNPKYYSLTNDRKSVEGSLAMFISTAMIIYFGLKIWYPEMQALTYYFVSLIIFCSLFATSWEAISSYGLDNLFIPLSVAWTIHNYLYGSANYFIDANLLGIIIAYFSFRLKFLNMSGAVAIYLLATIIYTIGGWMWTLPIFSFFILSSILSKIGKRQKLKLETIYEKSHKRDAIQVLANGGVAGGIILLSYFTPSYLWYLLFLVSIAVVTADTWGTEIGGLSKKNPRMIFTFRKAERGTSGAISIIGTIGGIIGAFTISIISKYFIDLNWEIIFIITIFGAIGSLIDSAIGMTLQAQYKCNLCGKSTERKIHCDNKANKISGFNWINNDVVNLLSAIATVFLAFIFFTKF